MELIEQTQTLLLTKANKEPETKIDGNYTPKWITPILLFIDLYEKVSNFFLNKTRLKKSTSSDAHNDIAGQTTVLIKQREKDDA